VHEMAAIKPMMGKSALIAGVGAEVEPEEFTTAAHVEEAVRAPTEQRIRRVFVRKELVVSVLIGKMSLRLKAWLTPELVIAFNVYHICHN